MRTLLTCVLSLTCISFASSDEAKPAIKPITDADTVIAIYTDGGRLGGRKLNLAAWPDGHIVWSEDRLHGGAPYRSGRIDPKKLGALLSRLDRDGAFADQKLSRVRFGPDAQFTTILAKSGKKQLEMRTWHELYEADGKLVATDRGLQPLENRRRLDVLRREPAEYLYYRLVWTEIRGEAAGLIPREGKPVDGELVMEKGVVSWQELPAKPKKKAAEDKNRRREPKAVPVPKEVGEEILKQVLERAMRFGKSLEDNNITDPIEVDFLFKLKWLDNWARDSLFIVNIVKPGKERRESNYADLKVRDDILLKYSCITADVSRSFPHSYLRVAVILPRFGKRIVAYNCQAEVLPLIGSVSGSALENYR